MIRLGLACVGSAGLETHGPGLVRNGMAVSRTSAAFDRLRSPQSQGHTSLRLVCQLLVAGSECPKADQLHHWRYSMSDIDTEEGTSAVL